MDNLDSKFGLLSVSLPQNQMDQQSDIEITEDHFKTYSGIFGYPNKHCETFDDEDLIYRKLVLPNIIIDELSANSLTSYKEYFEIFCLNLDECFIPMDIIIEIAGIYDDIFAMRIINFEYMGELSNRLHNELMSILADNNWINNYFSTYIQDLIYGISIIGEMLDLRITYFDIKQHDLLIRLINNLCVIIIYLKIYFESNILTNNSLLTDESKIIFI